MPVNTIILSLRSSTSVSSSAPPVCAMASTIEHARHDRESGKMSAEKLLVDRHVLDGDDAFFALQLEHAVDQQERIAVRQDLQDVVDVEHGFSPHSNLPAQGYSQS